MHQLLDSYAQKELPEMKVMESICSLIGKEMGTDCTNIKMCSPHSACFGDSAMNVHSAMQHENVTAICTCTIVAKLLEGTICSAI